MIEISTIKLAVEWSLETNLSRARGTLYMLYTIYHRYNVREIILWERAVIALHRTHVLLSNERPERYRVRESIHAAAGVYCKRPRGGE